LDSTGGLTYLGAIVKPLVHDESAVVDAVIVGVGGLSCALPVGTVIETMRPLPIQPIAGAPPAVLGVALIRGSPTVVVDMSRLLGADQVVPARFLTVRVGSRSIALAVESVTGVRALPAAQFHSLPPLLAGAASIEAIGTADAELLLVLSTACLVPEDVLRALDAEAAVE
jgi:purine-binding chemotaxis protein CheW